MMEKSIFYICQNYASITVINRRTPILITWLLNTITSIFTGHYLSIKPISTQKQNTGMSDQEIMDNSPPPPVKELSDYDMPELSFSINDSQPLQEDNNLDIPPIEDMECGPDLTTKDKESIPYEPMNISSLSLHLSGSDILEQESFKPSDAFKPSIDNSTAFEPDFENSDCIPQRLSELSSPMNFHGFGDISMSSPNGLCK